VADRPIDLSAGFAKVLESGRGSEMAVRLRQSLEVTDGLWELVPVVVAATKAHEQISPVQVADSSVAAKVLAGERRALLRKVGDTLRARLNTGQVAVLDVPGSSWADCGVSLM
jgi:hypothetical protein